MIYTVIEGNQALHRVKGSKFLAAIHPVTTKSESEKILQSIIDKLKNDFTLYELDAVYLEDVTLKIGIPNDSADHLIQKVKSHKHLFIKFEKLKDSFHILK